MHDYQGMVVLAVNQVWWTWEVEDVFQKVRKGDKRAMKKYSRKLHGQIDELVVKVILLLILLLYEVKVALVHEMLVYSGNR